MKHLFILAISFVMFSLCAQQPQAAADAQAKQEAERIRKQVNAANNIFRWQKDKYAEALKLYEALAADPWVKDPADQAFYRMRAALINAELQKKSPESVAKLEEQFKKDYPLLEPVQKAGITQSYVAYVKDQALALKLCRQAYDDAKNAPQLMSRDFVAGLCSRYMKTEQIGEAENIADEFFTKMLEKPNPWELKEFLKTMNSILARLDKQEKYIGNIEKVIAICKDENLKKQLFAMEAAAYNSMGDKQKAAELHRQAGDRLSAAFIAGGYDAQREEAKKMLADKTLPLKDRVAAFSVFYYDAASEPAPYYRDVRPPIDVRENIRIREQYGPDFYGDKDFKGSMLGWGKVGPEAWFSMYESVISMVYPEFLAGRAVEEGNVTFLTAAFVAVGRDADAVKVMTSEATNQKRSLPRRFFASLFTKMIGLKQEAEIREAFESVCNEFRTEKGFTDKMAGGTLVDMGRMFATGRKYDSLKALWHVYESLYRHPEKKSMTVKFSNTPVTGLGVMKAMKLETQLLDRQFSAPMDLVTDVSTGRTQAAKDGAKVRKAPEFSAVCDENGIHLLFHIYDERAEIIQTGMIGGGGFEMYFAPGENQPYTCLLTDNSQGTVHCWNTTYNTLHHRRFDEKKPGKFRYEQQFGTTGAEDKSGWNLFSSKEESKADGYDCYIFISWTNFYDKLPEKGDFYEFENVFWGPNGGESWTGMPCVHGRSSWGKLFFDITPEQMTKIKRKILFSAMPEYRRQHWTGVSHHGVYELWQDDILGDPEFYQAKVKPLREKLDAASKAVTKDISDEDVNRIFEESISDIRELRGNVEEMRRIWLEEKLSAE